MVKGRKESKCTNCGTINPGKRFKKPIFTMEKEMRECYACQQMAVPTLLEYCPTIDIEVQDPEQMSEIERIWVHLFGKDTQPEKVMESETVTITGNTYVEQKDGNSRARPIPVMYAHIVDSDKKVEQELSQANIQEILEWKANQKDIVGGLVSMFAPHIIGNEHCKEGMLTVWANAGIPNDEGENGYTRYRIHQLLIGDPGEAKTRFLEYIITITPGARCESAQSSTGLSLTAQVDRENNRYALRRGPMSLARGSICAVNEIDKMKSVGEQNHFLDTMEEGHFTINKYGRNYFIRANTSIIASANPINNTWSDQDKIDINELPVIEQIKQRFDIISVFKRPRSKAELIKYTKQKREVEKNAAAGMYKDYPRFLRNYYKYMRTFWPTIKEEALDMIDSFFWNMGDMNITGVKRRRESLKRLLFARARLKLKNVADEEEAEEIMRYYNMMLLYEQQVIAVSKRPIIETRDVCINILKKNKSYAYLVKELMDTARKDSEQVIQYIGSGDVSLQNKKVRNVVEQLLLPGSNIKKAGQNPVTLQYVDNDSGNDTDKSLPIESWHNKPQSQEGHGSYNYNPLR